jgi:hypothetical protein
MGVLDEASPVVSGPQKRYDGDHFSRDDILLNQRRLAPGLLSCGISDQEFPSCIVFGTMGGELQVVYQRAYALDERNLRFRSRPEPGTNDTSHG